MIERTLTIEELLEKFPRSQSFLMSRGIKCLACGEPVWGTLESEAKSKGFSEAEINTMISELRDFLDQEQD